MGVLGPLEVLGKRKDFAGGWVGSRRLNRWGLHPTRIVASNVSMVLRRSQLAMIGTRELGEFARDGVVAIPDFLDATTWAAVRDEAQRRLDQVAKRVALPERPLRGVRSEHRFEHGWDRCDGDTVSRFVFIRPDTTPVAAAAVRDSRLARVCVATSGYRHAPARFRIYETIQGDETYKPDSQKSLHKDTFHAAVKVWLFLSDVRAEHGPLEYVPGSHRMTRQRLSWEYRRAVQACAASEGQRGGAFRVSELERTMLGLPPPRALTVPANTLVIADVRGFHRRGVATVGARRLCLYANLRRNPFWPLAW